MSVMICLKDSKLCLSEWSITVCPFLYCNMKLSKTIDQTCICKKNYDNPLGYFGMGLFFLLVPMDKWPPNFTCPMNASTCPGQSEKLYCRGLACKIVAETLHCLTFIFYLKNVNKWNFCEDFLLKSCLNIQAMYQDYVQEQIWIFRFYMIFST